MCIQFLENKSRSVKVKIVLSVIGQIKVCMH